jgi:hypothetical protein
MGKGKTPSQHEWSCDARAMPGMSPGRQGNSKYKCTAGKSLVSILFSFVPSKSEIKDNLKTGTVPQLQTEVVSREVFFFLFQKSRKWKSYETERQNSCFYLFCFLCYSALVPRQLQLCACLTSWFMSLKKTGVSLLHCCVGMIYSNACLHKIFCKYLWKEGKT